MKNYKQALRTFVLTLIGIALAVLATIYFRHQLTNRTSPKKTDQNTERQYAHNVTLLKNTFKEGVLQNSAPVFVNFFAEWCPSCNATHPIIEEVAKDFANVQFVSVDVDQFEEVANTYSVQAIPTFILFNKGTAISRSTGFMSKEQMAEFIKNNLK